MRSIGKILSAILLFFTTAEVVAQEKSQEPFYVDIVSSSDKIVEAQLDMLGIQYNDRYGKSNTIVLKIFDWKRQEVVSVNLQKTFGLNYFKIPLKSLYGNWEIGKIYTCEMTDEVNHRYSLHIKAAMPPKKKDPSLDIIVNPVSFKCDDINQNLVEFYAKIDGGKPPYRANWYVFNSTRTKFLYQPKEEYIEKAGSTSVIEVDKNPVYYVMVILTDACGGMQEKMVELTCKNDDTGVNSAFVQPLDQSIIQNLLIR